MDTETNIHIRNVKIISVLFIIYWALELQPSSDNVIRLQMINYEIHNPTLLPWLANIALIYFGWRFWLATKKSGKFKHQYNSIFNAGNKGEVLKSSLFKRIMSDKFKKEANNFMEQKAQSHFSNNSPTISSENKKKLFTSEYTLSEARFLINEGPWMGSAMRWEIKDQQQRPVVYSLKLKISWYMLIPFRFKCLIKTISTTEHFATYTLSWALFFCAIVASILIRCGVTPSSLAEPQTLVEVTSVLFSL